MPRTIPPAWRNRIVGEDLVSPTTLVPHPHNWRIHGALQSDAMAGVLSEIGWVQRILVNRRSGRVVDGHLRLKLALDRNEPTVPVLYVDLSEAEEALVLSTLDPIAALAEADRGMLATLLQDVQSGEAGVQQLLATLAEEQGIVPPQMGESQPVAEPELEPDRLDELMQRWAVQPGDLWTLGDHRIVCADCLEPATLPRLLGGETPAMLWADPPYGISIVATNVPVGGGEAYDIPFGGVQQPRRRGYVGGGQRQKDLTGHFPIETWGQDKAVRGADGAAKPFGSKRHRGQIGGLGYKGGGVPFGGKQARGADGASHVVAVGKYAPVIGDDSTQSAIRASGHFLTTYPDAVHVWWGGNYYAHMLPPSSCWLVWNKETTGNFADCELAWTNQPKAVRMFTHRWNGMLRDSEHERRWHPTQKPAALAAWAYETLGEPGDLILDPFLGAGCSLLAAEQRQRRVVGCELSVEYIAITLERWAQLTGKQPVREAASWLTAP